MIRLRRRFRILYAALTQHWQVVTCACGRELYVNADTGTLLTGLLCDACESTVFEQWRVDYEARMGQQHKGVA